MALEIIREDITRVKVDAIGNPTDEYYTGLGGTDGRIHEAAGIKLREACDRLPSLSAGEGIVTDSFNMETAGILFIRLVQFMLMVIIMRI